MPMTWMDCSKGRIMKNNLSFGATSWREERHLKNLKEWRKLQMERTMIFLLAFGLTIAAYLLLGNL